MYPSHLADPNTRMCNAKTSYLFCFSILFSYFTSLSQRLHFEIWSIARDLAQSFMIEGAQGNTFHTIFYSFFIEPVFHLKLMLQ